MAVDQPKRRAQQCLVNSGPRARIKGFGERKGLRRDTPATRYSATRRPGDPARCLSWPDHASMSHASAAASLLVSQPAGPSRVCVQGACAAATSAHSSSADICRPASSTAPSSSAKTRRRGGLPPHPHTTRAQTAHRRCGCGRPGAPAAPAASRACLSVAPRSSTVQVPSALKPGEDSYAVPSHEVTAVYRRGDRSVDPPPTSRTCRRNFRRAGRRRRIRRMMRPHALAAIPCKAATWAGRSRCGAASGRASIHAFINFDA